MKIKRATSRQVFKEISAKRRMQVYYNRFTLGLKLFVAGVFLILCLTHRLHLVSDMISLRISELLQDYGFALENVVITGQDNLQNSEALKALNADRGTPILSINLDKTRQEIEKNPWVKRVLIERKLPNTIIINLKEREPIALWQVNKELFVIDNDGEILKNVTSEKYPNLIHVVGQDANSYASRLIEDLSTDEGMMKKVLNGVRYGQRRWDLNLVENINVKMPQENFLQAYGYLVKMNKEGKLFGAKIKSIDLRDATKIYIERSK